MGRPTSLTVTLRDPHRDSFWNPEVRSVGQKGRVLDLDTVIGGLQDHTTG